MPNRPSRDPATGDDDGGRASGANRLGPGDAAQLVRSRDPRQIAAMFNDIADRYDLMNKIMTAGQDVRWRRLAADAARLRPGGRALDVATGTGDLARDLARRVMPGGEVVGVDIAEDMLAIGRRKLAGLPVRLMIGDAMNLPFHDEFDAATVAFGFRNFTDRRLGLENMRRALRPGGRLVVLELTPDRASPPAPLHRNGEGSLGEGLSPNVPTSSLDRVRGLSSRILLGKLPSPLEGEGLGVRAGLLHAFIAFYTHRVIPLLGRIIAGHSEAYTYLPGSIEAMPTADGICALMREVGLVDVAARRLNFGTVALCWGCKPSSVL